MLLIYEGFLRSARSPLRSLNFLPSLLPLQDNCSIYCIPLIPTSYSTKLPYYRILVLFLDPFLERGCSERGSNRELNLYIFLFYFLLNFLPIQSSSSLPVSFLSLHLPFFLEYNCAETANGPTSQPEAMKETLNIIQ